MDGSKKKSQTLRASRCTKFELYKIVDGQNLLDSVLMSRHIENGNETRPPPVCKRSEAGSRSSAEKETIHLYA